MYVIKVSYLDSLLFSCVHHGILLVQAAILTFRIQIFPGPTSMLCHVAYFQLKYEKFDLEQFLKFMKFSFCLLL